MAGMAARRAAHRLRARTLALWLLRGLNGFSMTACTVGPRVTAPPLPLGPARLARGAAGAPRGFLPLPLPLPLPVFLDSTRQSTMATAGCSSFSRFASSRLRLKITTLHEHQHALENDARHSTESAPPTTWHLPVADEKRHTQANTDEERTGHVQRELGVEAVPERALENHHHVSVEGASALTRTGTAYTLHTCTGKNPKDNPSPTEANPMRFMSSAGPRARNSPMM